MHFKNHHTFNRRAVIAGAIAVAGVAPRLSAATPEATPAAESQLHEIAFARGSELWLIDTHGENERMVVDFGSYIHRLAWSPSGRYVHARCLEPDKFSLIYDVETGERVPVKDYGAWAIDADELLLFNDGGEGPAGFYRISPTGKRIATIRVDMPEYDQCMIDFQPTDYLFLTWMQGSGMFTGSAYGDLQWSAELQVAYMSVGCGDTIEFDLATGDGIMLETPVLNLTERYLWKPTEGGDKRGVVLKDHATGDEWVFTAGNDRYPSTVVLPNGDAAGFTTVPDDSRTDIPANARNALEVLRQSPNEDLATSIAELAYSYGGAPTVTTDGRTMVIGVLDYPEELGEWEFNNASYPELEDIHSDHFHLVSVDLPTGEHRVLTEWARLPRVRPEGD